MKYKITLYLITLLLTSCTILEKAGIEKRRYRPGYYLSSASSQRHTHQQIPDGIADEKINKALKTDNTPAKPAYDNDIADVSSQERSVPISTNKKGAGVISKAKSLIEKIQCVRPSHELFTRRSAVCAAEKQSNIKHWGDGCDNGCGNVLGEIIILILALIILALFPGIPPQAAELMAVAIILVAAVVIFIVVSIR